ncbi:PREDICTED: solute carrier family 26 member 6-like isoform X1 [Eufriesea mexicana]|uniref:solute carrier family 26 member 6-like isoform X1 n=3 Tax=Eufriesea mexicana TaxID=516756 RepID=UPI00083BC9E0|nr:PREDICTED: solute carrier family 26 member 6-like isoform X1 [Eufriesea mexicana]
MTDYLSDDMSTINPELTVRRPIYQQDELNHLYKYAKPNATFAKNFSTRCKKIKPMTVVKNSIPLIGWMSAYDWRNDILGDIIAGITVAVMHIPQGMAYAILGNVPPIVGIYMAFFPVLVYFFLGTSKHNSMGTFALICMMTGKVVATYSSQGQYKNGTMEAEMLSSTGNTYSPVEVATAVTFTVALIELVMYLLRLGVIATLLADSLVSGFITSAAIHVFTSQVKDLLGLKNLPKRKGAFRLILSYVDFLNNIKSINGIALLLSTATILILVINNVLKPRISKLSPFPIPIEMLVVIIGTVFSVYLNLADVYGITIVGDIPVGLPVPTLPPLSLMPNILLDSFVITMVSYTISMSMALIFAQKLNYEVDSNQELMAQGVGNLVGSFFSCMPFTASLSRSLIQQTVGGRTQLASLISCGILISVLLWIGPFFEPLPRCILASIIVVALKGMIMKVTEFKRFWKLDKMDGTIWAVTFTTVIILDVEYGLLIGIMLCIGKLILFSVQPYTCSLALVPGTELYLDSARYKGTVEVPGIRIFHYSGSLNFASRQHFRDEIYRIAGQAPQKESNGSFRHDELKEVKKLRTLILDLSSLSHIDLAGATTLGNLINEYCEIDIPVYVAGCSGPVYEMMRKCNLLEYKSGLFAAFPTVADAVHFAKCNSELTIPAWSSSIFEDTSVARL